MGEKMIDGTNLPYADTEVSIDKSRHEINELLKKYGVEGIQWTWVNNHENLRFIHQYEFEGVKHGVAYEIQIPEIGHLRGLGRERKLVRNDNQAYRVVAHVLKARFVSVECGLKTFENEFLSDIIYKLPNGNVKSVGDIILNQIRKTQEIKLLEE